MDKVREFDDIVNKHSALVDDLNPQLALDVTEAKKTKKDNELAKRMMDYWDSYTTKTPEEYANYDENMELHRGSWTTLEDNEDAINFNVGGTDYGISGLKMRHFGIINRVSTAILGEFVQNPLITMVTSHSSASKNYKDRHRLEIAQQYLHNRLVRPKVQRIQSEFLQQMGIEDPSGIPPEEQQQLQEQMNQRVQSQLPSELMEAAESAVSPEEVIFQKFLALLAREQDMESKFIMGGEYAVTVAEEAYRVNTIHKKPYVEVLNPKYLEYWGSDHVEFIEDKTAAKYDQYLTPQDVIQKYGEELMKKDIKELERLFNQWGTGNTNNRGQTWERLNDTEFLANHPEFEEWIGEINTREGQDKLALMYAMTSKRRGAGDRNRSDSHVPFGIRESYICWKWTRWMKLVTREVNGKRVELWRDDHYTKNSAKGDIKVERHLVPQVWHGITLGEQGSDIKIKVEPVPWQYNSLENPFDVKLPILGRVYNTQQNNQKKVSFIDLGKPYQYEYNSLRRDWEKYRRTNLGKVLLMTANSLPDNMNFGDLYEMLNNLSIGIISDKYEGMNAQLDTNNLRQFDLNKAVDMASVLKDMEYVKNEMYQAMYYNVAKLGMQGQYTTATTSQMNMRAADAMLAKFHNERKQVKERVLQYALDVTLAAYHDNDNVKAKILDDLSIAYFEKNYEYLSTKEYSVFVVDDYREGQKLEFIRQQLQAFIQNGASTTEIIAMAKAESLSEMEKVAERVERRQQQQAQATQQSELKRMQMEQKQEIDLQKWLEERRALRQERENEVRLRMAELNSMQMANANDIDENKVPDSVQKARLEIDAKERMLEKELRAQERLKDKELRSKEKVANAKRQP